MFCLTLFTALLLTAVLLVESAVHELSLSLSVAVVNGPFCCRLNICLSHLLIPHLLHLVISYFFSSWVPISVPHIDAHRNISKYIVAIVLWSESVGLCHTKMVGILWGLTLASEMLYLGSQPCKWTECLLVSGVVGPQGYKLYIMKKVYYIFCHWKSVMLCMVDVFAIADVIYCWGLLDASFALLVININCDEGLKHWPLSLGWWWVSLRNESKKLG